MEPVYGSVLLVVLSLLVVAGIAAIALPGPRSRRDGEPKANPRAEPRPEPAPAPPSPEPILLPVPRDAAKGADRWVPLLAAIAPVAAFGAYLHHRRFVKYHELKGKPPPTSFTGWVAAETRGAATFGWWHFKAFRRDGLRVPEKRTGRTVLCIHGYSQNATNFHGLREVLEAAGRPTVALSFGYWLAPMSWYASRLERKLEEVAAEHPDGFDLVAHSMGGVVLRIVLARRPDLRERLRTVVTLGSPHRGTASARGIPFLPEVRAMKRRSALLAELPHLPALLPHGRVVTMAGDADTICYPVETALITGTHKVVLPGVGHAGLLTSQLAWDAVRRALDDGDLRSPS